MTTETMHALPSWRVALVEEVRAVGLRMRMEMLAALLAGAAAAAAVGIAYNLAPLEERGEWALSVSPMFAMPAVLVALFFPLLVWRGEGVGRRDYLWSLPLDRGSAHLSKAFSGWVWAMGLLAVYLLGLCALAVALGGEIGVSHVMVFSNLPEAVVPPRPGATISVLSENFYRIRVAVPAWQWLAPFVAVTLAYLFGSAIVIGSRFPYVWGVVVWGILMFVVGISEANLGTATDLASALLQGRYGLGTLLTGEVEYVTRLAEAEGVRFQSLSRIAEGRAWAAAVVIWAVPVVALFLFATRRRREG